VLAVAGGLVTLLAANGPARADELIEYLGPVGPLEPILSAIGSKRVIAFYEPAEGQCAFQAVIWEKDDIDARTASRLRLSLGQGQIAHIDSDWDKSLNIRCEKQALSVVSVTEHIKFGPVQFGPTR
jgi:hypothetical protein